MKKNPNTAQFWDKYLISLPYIPSQDFVTKDRIENVANLIPNSRINLLDIGSGYGFLEQKLVPKKNIELFCIDISFKGLEKLKRNFVGKFLTAISRSIPFRDEVFDYVCLMEVLEHLHKREAQITFSEIYRVLKPGGKLIISVPLYDEPVENHPSGHVRMYTQSLIFSEILNNGFEILSCKEFFAFRSNYLLKKVINRILKIRKFPNDIIILARKK